ncbi:MAG TPA: Rrf2 family transcriptional regulator [Spirochaetia bacterium]|nr:Rrf2 family transcriptional regulator [Spirochaetia bacterium]
MISRSGIHAFKAMAVLGGLPPEEYLGAEAIAARIHAPGNYLGKLLRQLSRAGVVEGRKGGNGGFRLARPRETITLLEVLEPIERVVRAEECILGRPRCSAGKPCALHVGWSHVRTAYLEFLRTTKVSELGA